MFCGECGTQNPDTNAFCKNCGKPLRKPQQTAAQQAAAVPAAPASPVPPSPVPQTVGSAPAPILQPVPAAAVKPPLSRGMLLLGILGMIAGIVSWFFYPYICGSTAVVLGGIAFARPGSRKGIIRIIAVLAILTGLASILVDNFYYVLFPPSLGTLLWFWLAP